MSNFVVGPSRNKIVQAAFEGLRKEQRAEKKAKPAEPAPASIPKHAGTKKPATKKPAKPPRAKGGKTRSKKT